MTFFEGNVWSVTFYVILTIRVTHSDVCSRFESLSKIRTDYRHHYACSTKEHFSIFTSHGQMAVWTQLWHLLVFNPPGMSYFYYKCSWFTLYYQWRYSGNSEAKEHSSIYTSHAQMAVWIQQWHLLIFNRCILIINYSYSIISSDFLAILKRMNI